MELEEIKSPLPPRKTPFKAEELGDEKMAFENKEEVVKREIIIEKEPLSQKKINKKIIYLLLGLFLLVVLTLLAFSFFKQNKVKKIVNLTYWGLWEDESVMNGVIADFESKNPNIKITYKKNLKDGYRGRLSGRLAKTGVTEDVPDIYRIHNSWIPMFKDYLSPVPTKIALNIGLESDYFDVYKNDLKEDGQWLSVPLMYDGLVMFYNSDLLSKSGVEVPKDWWSFKKAAVKITQKDEKNKIKIAGAGIGLIDNVDHWSDIVGLMMKQNGVNTKNINSVESKTKLKDVFSFYTLFKTSDKVWDESLPNSTIFFASGNLGFYFGPSWRVFDIQSLNPNLKFETASMPQLPTNLTNEDISSGTELTNIHWSSYWTEGVNIKSENQQEAWKFIEYLSSPEVLENMYKAASQIRSFGLIYPRKSMMTKINSNSKLTPFVENANNASNWYLSSNTFDEGLNTSMQKYFSDAINGILINNNDSEEMTDTVISGILQLQQRYKLSK